MHPSEQGERNVANSPKIRPQKSCDPGKKGSGTGQRWGPNVTFLRYILQEKANRYRQISSSPMKAVEQKNSVRFVIWTLI